MRLPLVSAFAVALVAGGLSLVPADAAHAPRHHASSATPEARRAPVRFTITTKVGGLSHPWDVGQIGQRRLLITERDPAQLTVWQHGKKRAVKFPTGKIWQSGETGLMGLEIDPHYPRTHRFYTCSGWNLGGGRHDVRVVSWRMNDDATRARQIKTLVKGFPTTSGRHGGCRLLIASDGSMLVGTGDAATGTNPESLSSLGGKTLRLDPVTGKPWRTNPFIKSKNTQRRYIQTYGHRNVQGLTQRDDGSLWSIEQGTDRDDEVNKLVNGGDYGYNPVPGYNESVPMTDQSLPGKQIGAKWSSGDPTYATSGGTFVYGKKWGLLNGTMAVAALKDSEVVFLRFDAKGNLTNQRIPSQLQQCGRLRTVVQQSDGNLLVLTDGDSGTDRVLLVKPA